MPCAWHNCEDIFAKMPWANELYNATCMRIASSRCSTVCCMSMNHFVCYYAAVCLLNALLLLLNMRSDVALDFTACPAVSSG